MRSALSQARGLGSAKDGSTHWWVQRVTAVALVPLAIWLLASLVALGRGNHADFIVWLQSPLNAILMVSLVIALFWHMALGLQVVVEDYAHSRPLKIFALLAIHTGCALLVVTGLVSIARTIA
ncbi:MAG: succinate dehydrogenase, hydrophobic membrane anchor protein [Acidobacteriota bacterium]